MFLEEVQKIEGNQTGAMPQLQRDSSQPKAEMLQNYKDSRAFKTLLRRQGQVVTRLNRIKENFSKKRQQITLLSVRNL